MRLGKKNRIINQCDRGKKVEVEGKVQKTDRIRGQAKAEHPHKNKLMQS